MGPFWKHFSEDVGHYGRHGGTVFLITIGAGVGLLVVTCILGQALGKNFPFAVGGAGFIIFAAFFRAILRARRHRGRYLIQPLSREEIRRARSKLIGNQKARKL
jgi:hypothetical protein